MLTAIGFDGDDTLWQSETAFHITQAQMRALLADHVDGATLDRRLLEVERVNLAIYGYGAKSYTLSMIETAIDLAGDRLGIDDVSALLTAGKELLAHPIELLPGAEAAVRAVKALGLPVLLITKGDLFHQEYKVARSGLADIFHRIEIVSEKDPAAYARLFAEFEVTPDRFAMVGNSLKSDIAPVVALGGWGVYMPYHSTWAHELVSDFAMGDRVVEVAGAEGVPAAIARMHAA
jgi:putative hydrolase of the HAD superfamily